MFDLIILNDFEIAGSPNPGWVDILVQSESGVDLGKTKICYFDEETESVQRVLHKPKLLKSLLDELYHSYQTQNAGNPSMLIIFSIVIIIIIIIIILLLIFRLLKTRRKLEPKRVMPLGM